MCGTCGCNKPEHSSEAAHSHDEHHHHHGDVSHEHHQHEHSGDTRLINLELDILAHNNAHAAENREWLNKRGVVAINIMSSPGSGKTTLLEKTLSKIGDKYKTAVIVGDQKTDLDAKRLQMSGCNVVQIETGELCHLDAAKVGAYFDKVVSNETKLLIIENIGNLICPASFDLGEHKRVTLLSVTEGEDKPLKYPAMFSRSDVVLLTKSDLLPHLDYSIEVCQERIHSLTPQAEVIVLSSSSGSNFDLWLDYLSRLVEEGSHTSSR